MYYSFPSYGNSSDATSEQKLWSHVTQTILFSRDLIERDEWIRCHVVDYVCEKGHEFVESLTLPCETSRAIHVNIDLLGHAKKEEIHRQAENLRLSLRDYMNARQTWEEIIIYWIAFPCERICSRITIDEVKMLIAKDETRTPELKKMPNELHRGMETTCAFLDSDGGVAG